MSLSKHVTTRALMRNFKTFKQLLLNGNLQYILINVGEDQELELSVRKDSNTASDIAASIASLPAPIHLEKSDLFEELLEPRKI